jgi:ketosteroid isomerase-like protein
MPEGNVERTYRLFEAFNSGDREGFLALMDEAVEASPRIRGGLGGDLRGHLQLRQWWDDLFDLLPDFEIHPLEVHDLGDVTVAPTRYRGHGGTSRTPFDETNWIAYRWFRGRCVRWASKGDEAKALEAVGLQT